MENAGRLKEGYQKYRWFFTSSGKLVVGGKSSSQNEELMRNVDAGAVVMHTAAPGSPFCIIKEPDARDMEETAIFTACFSHDWKNLKKRSEVHVFRGTQVAKRAGMKKGAFGITGRVFKKKVELKLIITIQKGRVRAVPPTAAKKRLAVLTPGTLSKEQAVQKIMKILRDKHGYPASKDEVMAAVPSDNIGVKG